MRRHVVGVVGLCLAAGCAPTLPPGMQGAISKAVVADTTRPGSIFYSAGVDSFEVKDAKVESNKAWVHAWIGVWFKNRVSGAGFTAHNVVDEEFSLHKQAGQWTVTSIKRDGFAPGGGP